MGTRNPACLGWDGPGAKGCSEHRGLVLPRWPRLLGRAQLTECGQLGAVFVGCLPEGVPNRRGFPDPSRGSHVWPVSNSRGSAGRKPASTSQHRTKGRFRRMYTHGPRGPSLKEPCRGLIPQGGQQGEEVCYGGDRTLPGTVTRPTASALTVGAWSPRPSAPTHALGEPLHLHGER